MIALILSLGAGQGLFLAILLAAQRRARPAVRYLAAALAVMALDLASAAFHAAGLEARFPHFIGADFALGFLYGPLFYFYARRMVLPADRGGSAWYHNAWYHFVPFSLALLLLLPFYGLAGHEKLDLSRGVHVGYIARILEMLTHAKVAHALGYVCALWVLLRGHASVLSRDRNRSIVEGHWLRSTVFGGVIVAAVAAVLYVLRVQVSDQWVGADPSSIYDMVTLLTVTAFVYAIGYFGLKNASAAMVQSDASTSILEIPAESNGSVDVQASPRVPRYERSGMDAIRAEGLRDDLLLLMTSKAPHLRSDLSLAELADMLGTTPHNLTEVLNARLGVTFYDFINGYRVEEAMRRLADRDSAHLSILGIALEAGFNSKSTFYSVFKRHTGTTPTAFRERPVVVAPQ